jgi:hypothetical protein
VSPRRPLKTFSVHWSITDVYETRVRACDPASAIEKAKARFLRYGEDPGHGIFIEPFSGETHGWEADEVQS